MRAIGYFRQPAGKPGIESISVQNRCFLDFCEKQGYEVAATFSEESEAEHAPAFAQLIEYMKKPEKGFVVVVADTPETLGDDAAIAAARWLQIERLGGRFQFLHPEAPDALGAILQTWPSGPANGLGEKVRAAMRRKAVRGEVLGRPPYGYNVGPNNKLTPVQEEAVVVRYIFHLYLREGLGIRLIARRLNEEGARTRRNRPWSMVSIRDILRNRVYLGTYQRLGFRVPGTHEALVAPDDFRRVQDRLAERRTNYTPKKVTPFLLSGLAVCGHCGNRMIGVSRRQSWKRRSDGSEQSSSYRYYQCGSRTNQGICSYHTVRAEDLESTVREQIVDAVPNEKPAGDETAFIAEWQAEARRLRERLRQIDRRIGKSLAAALGDKGARERFRAQGMDLADERLRVETDLAAAERRADTYASAAERRKARSDALESLISDWEAVPFARRQDLLREVVDRVEVTDEQVRTVLRP